jgi:flagellar hook assembly protein FlgD
VLSFTTSEAGPVRVQIYSAMGRHVRTLDEPATSPGRQAIRFNGTDASGRRLASGIYFYRIEAGSSRAKGRFAVVK